MMGKDVFFTVARRGGRLDFSRSDMQVLELILEREARRGLTKDYRVLVRKLLKKFIALREAIDNSEEVKII